MKRPTRAETPDFTIGDAEEEVVQKANFHGARRSVATHMAELGIAPHVIEEILNHQSGHKRGVAGTYNRAGYEPQKRHALNVWADHWLAIVEGRATATAVVPLRG